MKRVLLVVSIVCVLFLHAMASDVVFGMECLDLRKLVEQEIKSADKFSLTFQTYGVAECKNVQGRWFCLECEESGGSKLLSVQEDLKGKLQFKGYGCQCREKAKSKGKK
ncbi:MAG: hypothetical protein HY913_21060 [Desulfomonile tiedjei]|nr:hypothetical protein [Desulfomonile tiedjei]